jgi:NTP pyrophosphatase (non-canonical NTP hydrolase)
MNVARIQSELARFAQEREWKKFHSPKNIVMALAGETGELVSLFQWLSEDESRNIDENSLGLAKRWPTFLFICCGLRTC